LKRENLKLKRQLFSDTPVKFTDGFQVGDFQEVMH
jgi:hypothetical protein